MGPRYLIFGAGGTGAALGAHLLRGGLEAAFIARGRQLEALRREGLRVEKPGDSFSLGPVQAYDSDSFDGSPEVVFLCVKGYSLEGALPFLRRVCGEETLVIPILNLPDTGAWLSTRLPGVTVTEGCMYIASQVISPGLVHMSGSILRVVFGLPGVPEPSPALTRVRDELRSCGVEPLLSPDIRRDCMMKFSYVSPQGACGLYYDVPAGAMQRPGEIRDTFAALVREIGLLSGAMGSDLGPGLIERNLAILDGVEPDMTTSLQRDIRRGGASELEGLIYRVPQMAAEHGLRLPTYEMIAAALRKRGLR